MLTMFAGGDFLSEYAAGPLERTGETEGIPYVERPAMLFEAGTHKGQPWTPTRLKAIVDHFNASQKPTNDRNWGVPLQLGHPEKGKPMSPRDTVGSLREAWLDGNKIFGWVRAVGQAAIDNVRGGLWNRLSVGITSNNELDHVAIVPQPHIAAAGIFDKGDSTVSKPKNAPACDPETEDEEEAGTEDAEPTNPPKKPKGKAKEYAADPAEIVAMRAEIAKLSAEMEHQRAEFAKEREAAEAEKAKIAAFARAKDKVTTLANSKARRPPGSSWRISVPVMSIGIRSGVN